MGVGQPGILSPDADSVGEPPRGWVPGWCICQVRRKRGTFPRFRVTVPSHVCGAWICERPFALWDTSPASASCLVNFDLPEVREAPVISSWVHRSMSSRVTFSVGQSSFSARTWGFKLCPVEPPDSQPIELADLGLCCVAFQGSSCSQDPNCGPGRLWCGGLCGCGIRFAASAPAPGSGGGGFCLSRGSAGQEPRAAGPSGRFCWSSLLLQAETSAFLL